MESKEFHVTVQYVGHDPFVEEINGLMAEVVGVRASAIQPNSLGTGSSSGAHKKLPLSPPIK